VTEPATVRWPAAAGLVATLVVVILVGGVVLARRVQTTDVAPVASATALATADRTSVPTPTVAAAATTAQATLTVAAATPLPATTPPPAATPALAPTLPAAAGAMPEGTPGGADFSVVFVNNTPQVVAAGATPPAVPTPTEWWNQQNTYPPALGDEVNAAYNHFWQVRAQALLDLDPSSLPTVLDGSALQRELQNLDTLRENDQAQQIDIQHHAQVMHATDADATVFDNYTSRIVTVDLSTNEPVAQSPSGDVFLAYHLQKLSGAWKVVEAVQINT
jgi:hypothetical protein